MFSQIVCGMCEFRASPNIYIYIFFVESWTSSMLVSWWTMSYQCSRNRGMHCCHALHACCYTTHACGLQLSASGYHNFLPSSDFYRVLKERVNKYFKENNIVSVLESLL